MKKCPHGRQRSRCKACGGSQICKHGRQRSQCKECGGSQICKHGRERCKCKECGGGSICEHGRIRCTCKACNPEGAARVVAYNATAHGQAMRKARIHRRRARILQVGGVFTAAEFIALCRRYHQRCACCGRSRKLTPDHILCVSKGGRNVIENLQPLCLPCNSSKSYKIGAFTCVCGRHHKHAAQRMRPHFVR